MTTGRMAIKVPFCKRGNGLGGGHLLRLYTRRLVWAHGNKMQKIGGKYFDESIRESDKTNISGRLPEIGGSSLVGAFTVAKRSGRD